MKKVKLTINQLTLIADLRDTPTAERIFAALPISSTAQTWGDEIYFSVPVHAELEADARDVVEAGEWAFWVAGDCIAIGFGPTPVSVADEIRLADKTNIWADCRDDVRQLCAVKPGDSIQLTAVVSEQG